MAHVVGRPAGHKRVKCPHCLALIGYSPNEVQRRDGTDYGGGPDGAKWIVCPNRGCGKDIILEQW